jgi:hypothetical protein
VTPLADRWSPASAFHYDRKVRTATLSPPATFAGSASLRRDPNVVSPLWSGNLMLAFPGQTVPIAGPAVHVSLEHGPIEHGNNRAPSPSASEGRRGGSVEQLVGDLGEELG